MSTKPSRPELLSLLVRQGYAGLPGVWASEAERSTDVRLLGRHAVMVRGGEGARLFYDDELFERHHAVPAVVANPLFGRGAVHGLDGSEHDQRKAVFLAALTPPEVDDLATSVAQLWEQELRSWAPGTQADVFAAAVQVLGRAVLSWVGADVPPTDVAAWCDDLAVMVDDFGSPSPVAAWRRRAARRRAEAWATEAVQASRRDGASGGRPIDRLARATDPEGALLDARTAAVEVLNLVRPTVAVAWFVAFATTTIAGNPRVRAAIGTATGTPEQRRAFAHELRRYHPFVPVLTAKARRPVDCLGRSLETGHHLVLDVWGTHHLATRWDEPDAFHLEHFLGGREGSDERDDQAFDFVPQGGGYPETGHRCPGEPATVRIIEECSRLLADLPYQLVGGASYSMADLPTRPRAVVAVRPA